MSSFTCSQAERFKRLYATCQHLPSRNVIANLSDKAIKHLAKGLLVAEKLKTVVCLTYKVAWTTQRVVLTNNSSPEPIPSDLGNAKIWRKMEPNKIMGLSRYPANTIRYILKHYFKYMFVRHPLERIYSGYYDKIVYERFIEQHGNYYRQLVPKILKRIRPDLLDQPVESVHLPFYEVLQYIKAGGSDMHFARNYAGRCRACLIKYDYIGKTETFDEDMNYIITQNFPAGRGKGTKRNAAASVSGSSLGSSHIFHKKLEESENITQDLIDHIEKKYAMDFEQFGYKIEKIDGEYYSSCEGGCC